MSEQGLTPSLFPLRTPESGKAPASEDDEFSDLLNQWHQLPNDVTAHIDWIDELITNGETGFVDRFQRFFREKTVRAYDSEVEKLSHGFLVTQLQSRLERANWRVADYESMAINEHLWRHAVNVRQDYVLGTQKDSLFALRINGQALSPPETTLATSDKYHLTAIFPHNLLAMRYQKFARSPSPEKLETFLFVTLGSILRQSWKPISKRMHSEDFDTKIPGSEWTDTGYLLLLRIENDGTAKKYFVAHESCDANHLSGPNDPVPSFCDGTDRFTVAELIQPSLSISFHAKEVVPVSWDILSISTAQVAETGVRGSWSRENPPVALF